MKVAITDANIFIDLIYVELHEELFALGLELHTTFEVFDELKTEQQSVINLFVKQNQLQLHAGSAIVAIESIRAKRGLSESDKSVLHLAISLNAAILTGDGHLRKVSEQQQIEVHGIFWLFDRFIHEKILTKKKACTALSKLMGYNKRLPYDECKKRLANWSE